MYTLGFCCLFGISLQFYGNRRKGSILGSRDGALVVIEVYDASVSIHHAKYTDLLPPDNTTIRSILPSHIMTSCSLSSSPPCSSPSNTPASSSSSSAGISPVSEGLRPLTSLSSTIRDNTAATPRCLSGPRDQLCADVGKTVPSMCSDNEESRSEKREEIESHGESGRGRYDDDDPLEKKRKDVAAGGEEEEEEASEACDERDDREEEFSFFHKKNRRLVMKCPLTRQIVNRFSSSAWEIICSEFQRAEHLIRNQQGSLENICLPASLSHRQTKKLSKDSSRRLFY